MSRSHSSRPSQVRRRLRNSLRVAAFGVLLGSPVRAGDPPLTMFVTSTTGPATFGSGWTETTGLGLSGLIAADRICQVRAELALLATAGSPVFRAWLSVPGTDAFCHVQGLTGTKLNSCNGFDNSSSKGPWFRKDGVAFSERLDSFNGQQSLSPPAIDETGTFRTNLAWTGSNGDGSATGSTCSSWASTIGFGSVGSNSNTYYWGELALDGTLGCAGPARLYCFQEGAGPSRQAWPEPAALVFLTPEGGAGALSGFPSGDTNGIDGGDEVCRNIANQAGLPGADSFRAWLSDDVTDAKDRFSITGPWYRLDGIRVAASLAAMTDGNIDTSISHTTNGPLSAPEPVWTGTFSGGTKSANNCADWFSPNAEDHGTPGNSGEASFAWTTSNDPDLCNTAHRLYCFGDVIVIFWDDFDSVGVSRWSNQTGFVP